MPIPVATFMRDVDPRKTVLLFGAGSSIPSGGPTVLDLQMHFERTFKQPAAGYKLSEQAQIIENTTRDRRGLITALQSKIQNLKPTGAILNLPLYEWKSIFTTNYDELIEIAYQRKSAPLKVYASNFDFREHLTPNETELFKLHGTISQDKSLGNQASMILTDRDYDQTELFRQQLYDRLKTDIGGNGHLIVIGHSLGDPDIRDIVLRALRLKQDNGLQTRISCFIYEKDDGRATLFEDRNIEVVFGGLDDFFANLVPKLVPSSATSGSLDPLDHVVALRPTTLDANHAIENQPSNVSGMYNGWPATYGDITHGLTFRRSITDQIVTELSGDDTQFVVLLGPSGVGKTTAARQVLHSLAQSDHFAWEHSEDQAFLTPRWREVGKKLQDAGQKGVLFVDDAHIELQKVSELIDWLHRERVSALKVITVSSNHNWGPRSKSPIFYKAAKTYYLNRVSDQEVDRLLDLVDHKEPLRLLVERDFSGFSRQERRRRLIKRCSADMFVCLKNIFSSESFDNIILREYSVLAPELQEIYKSVAAMETSGVHVHRQLVVRMLGIQADHIEGTLQRLVDIIHEETVDTKRGIYSWRGRHKVIMKIIADNKYFKTEDRYAFFDKVISNIYPSYDIELKTITDLCDVENGLGSLSDVKKQNILLRRMISIAPSSRIPRHRLIRNLLSLGHYDAADTEIKMFKGDFRMDAPIARYQINLSVARAVKAKGLMKEDRVVQILKAEESASYLVGRYASSKSVLKAYCELGLSKYKLTGNADAFDKAITLLRDAEEEVGDPDIARAISRFEERMAHISVEAIDDIQFEDVDQD